MRGIATLFLTMGSVLLPRMSFAQLTTETVMKFFVPEANAFAESIALYEDTVLVGTVGPEAYVFQLEGGQWWMNRLVVPGSTQWFLEFALDRDLALIGAKPYAYVFRYDGMKWVHEATLTDDRGARGFAGVVDVDGDVAVVGTRSVDVQIFRFDGKDWVREARLAPPPSENGKDPYGFAEYLALDGDRVLVSKASTIGDPFEGVYSFRYDGNGWHQEGVITLGEPGSEKTVFQGRIALDGDRALIDADYDDVVHVFRFNGVAWEREAILSPPDLETRQCYCVPPPAGGGERCDDSTPNFGVSVALDGNLALVGANLDDVNGVDSGAAYLYRYGGAKWSYETVLLGESGLACGGDFGRLVELHEGRALVRRGHAAYFFRIHGWNES